MTPLDLSRLEVVFNLILGKIIILQLCTFFSKPARKCMSSFNVSQLDTPFLILTLLSLNNLSLIEDNKNVVVVHCDAGKGRTGTLISCYLIFSGLSDTADNAILYYG